MPASPSDATLPRHSHRRAPGFQYAAAALVLFLALLGSHLATPLYPIWQATLGFSTTQITIIFACYPVGVTLGLLYGGRLGDQFGRKPLILAGLVLTAAASLTYIGAATMLHLVVARLINGIAIGLLSGPAVAAIVELHPTADRAAASRVGAIATLCSPAAGLLLATMVVRFSAETTAVSLPFVLQLGGLALAVFLWSTYAETIRSENRRTVRTASYRPQTLRVPADIRVPFIFGTATAILGWAVTGLWLALGPALVAEVIGSTNRLTGGLIVVAFLTTAGLVQLFTRTLPFMRAILWSLVMAPPSLALILATLHYQSAAGLLLGAVLAGAAQGLGWMGSSELVNRIAPAQIRASVLSVLYISGYFGAAVPMIITGVFADIMGLFPAIALFLVVCILWASVLALLWVRYRRSAPWAQPAPVFAA